MKRKKLNLIKIESEADFGRFIRQVSTTEVIKNIYLLSKEVYLKRCKSIKRKITYNGIEGLVYIQPWQFADLAYQSIKFSNDYRNSDELSYDQSLLLLYETNSYIEMKMENNTFDLITQYDKDVYLYGLGGEQYEYQSEVYYFRNLIRELYILFSLTERSNYYKDIIEKEVGVNWQNLITILFGIFINSLFEQKIDDAVNYIKIDGNKEEIFKKVLKYYTADYKEIRESNLNRQIFYVKPYAKNQRNEIVTVSVYFNEFIVEHAAYWVIRNYYLKQESKSKQTFVNEFGILYEKYFENICIKYHVQKEKIKKSEKEKRADWKLQIDNQIILIEQKSFILPIEIKQQLTNVDKYKKIIERNIVYALEQLEQTEKNLNLHNAIKIVLCYDRYINSNLLNNIFDDENCKVKNDGRYFLANTTEIEMLLELSSSDKQLFKRVISDMINRKSYNGNSIMHIMMGNKWTTNSYYKEHIFDEYKELLKDIKNRHEKFRKL